jgi:16S rRNA (adenine1518-N6/adenine1519-N6)-dimethyltransferase
MGAQPFGGERTEAKKSLGQNFLIDPNLQRKIVESLEPSPADEVLEIGPGTGALTQHLAPLIGRLHLVELDRQLAQRLDTRFQDDPRVTVLNRDILEVELESLTSDPRSLKVIGNIPYNITTPIIFKLVERQPRPATIVLMVQKEVADRILAQPGGKTYGALAVGVQSVARVERVVQVGRKAFRPVPDVDSTVIRITPLEPPPLQASEEVALRTLTRAAFGQRRKQFQRILRDAFGLQPSDVEELERLTRFDLRARPETFAPAEFIRLSRALQEKGFFRADAPSGSSERPPPDR